MAEAPTPMPKRAAHGPLSQVKTLQEAFDHPQFLSRLKQATPKHITPERMNAVFVQACQKTPKLREVNLMSLLGAFISLASVGLEPNTALGHAYLVPFEKRGKNPQTGKWETIRVDVQVIFGYQGLLELTYRSGQLRSVHCDVVWPQEANDPAHWECWHGSGGKLIHRPRFELIHPDTLTDQDYPALTYMHANLKDGGEAYEIMGRADVLRIRNATQAYQTALRAKEDAERNGYKLPASWTETPWVRHPLPMIRKTALRAGSKWLPKSIEMAAALALDELQDRKRANFGAVIEHEADPLTDMDALEEDEEREPPPAARALEPARQAAGADPAPVRQVVSREGPTFYLVDEAGEIIDDVFTAPEGFAAALNRLLERSRPGDHDAILEHNADAIAQLPAELQRQFGPRVKQSEDAAKEIPLRRNGRGPDLNQWIKDARDALAKLTAETIGDWIGNNEPTWRPFPASKRLEVERAVAERASQLGLKWAPAQRTEQPHQFSPEEAEEFAGRAERTLAQTPTIEGVHSLAERLSTSMTQMQAQHPAIWQRVSDAFSKREEEIGGQPT